MDLPLAEIAPCAEVAAGLRPQQAWPFALRRPQTVGPVVVSSPHSGRDYPPEFLDSARLDAARLRRSEDSFVDELFGDAPDHGAPLLAATFPRAWCDANREPWELDPAMFSDALPAWANTTSARVGAGLGTIAKVVGSGEAIYRRKLRFAEAERRIRECWEPYHAALATLVGDARRVNGICLLLDCHSMPAGNVAARANGPDIVLGDVHGTACDPRLSRAAEGLLAKLGYSVRRNDPYAGGYVTRHYGRPREQTHALQIEIARHLYMDEARLERSPGLPRVRAHMAALTSALSREAVALA